MALAVNRTGTVFKKCDRSNHRPETSKACAADTCQHTCEPSGIEKSPHAWTLHYSVNGKQVEKSFRDKVHETSGRTLYGSGKKLTQDFQLKLTHIKPAFGDRTLAQVANDRDGVLDLLTVTMKHLSFSVDGAGICVWLMRGCGLRIEEALAVGKSDFIEDGTVLRVMWQASPDGRSRTALKKRRQGEYRDVPVPSWLWEMGKDRPDGVLMPGLDGSPISVTWRSTADSCVRLRQRASPMASSRTRCGALTRRQFGPWCPDNRAGSLPWA